MAPRRPRSAVRGGGRGRSRSRHAAGLDEPPAPLGPEASAGVSPPVSPAASAGPSQPPSPEALASPARTASASPEPAAASAGQAPARFCNAETQTDPIVSAAVSAGQAWDYEEFIL
eukprot:4333012-Lingulodinium_polyedra.AAC.1